MATYRNVKLLQSNRGSKESMKLFPRSTCGILHCSVGYVGCLPEPGEVLYKSVRLQE